MAEAVIDITDDEHQQTGLQAADELQAVSLELELVRKLCKNCNCAQTEGVQAHAIVYIEETRRVEHIQLGDASLTICCLGRFSSSESIPAGRGAVGSLTAAATGVAGTKGTA